MLFYIDYLNVYNVYILFTYYIYILQRKDTYLFYNGHPRRVVIYNNNKYSLVTIIILL